MDSLELEICNACRDQRANDETLTLAAIVVLAVLCCMLLVSILLNCVYFVRSRKLQKEYNKAKTCVPIPSIQADGKSMTTPILSIADGKSTNVYQPQPGGVSQFLPVAPVSVTNWTTHVDTMQTARENTETTTHTETEADTPKRHSPRRKVDKKKSPPQSSPKTSSKTSSKTNKKKKRSGSTSLKHKQ